MRILNRIVEWTEDGISVEGDQRPVEICENEIGLEDNSRVVTTPCEKCNRGNRADDRATNAITAASTKRSEELLPPSAATRYRAVIARCNYLGQDRSDIQYAVKELGKDMSSPTQESWYKMKKDWSGT